MMKRAEAHKDLVKKIKETYPYPALRLDPADVSSAASCILNGLHFLEPNRCESNEPCIYQTRFDGLAYCDAERNELLGPYSKIAV